MATLLTVGDIVEFQVACFAGNQVGLNSWHYGVFEADNILATDELAAQTLDGILAPLYKPLLHNTASYIGITAQIINRSPKPATVTVAASTGVGTGGNVPLPSQVSGVITKQTVFAGRTFRGRCYIPFPSAAYNDTIPNKPTAAYVTALGNLITGLTPNISLANGLFFTRLQPVLWRSKTSQSQALSGFRANQKWGTQRRRGNYGQANVIP